MNKSKYSAKFLTRQTLTLISSTALLGLAICFYILANIGSDPMTTFEQGLMRFVGLNIATWNVILNVLLALIAFILKRNEVGLGSLIYPFAVSGFITLFQLFMPTFVSGIMRYVFFGLGFLLMCVSIAIGSQLRLGKNPYDAFVFSIAHACHSTYDVIRVFVDGSMLLGGILLRGSWGIGTVIAVLGIGPTAGWMIRHLPEWAKEKEA